MMACSMCSRTPSALLREAAELIRAAENRRLMIATLPSARLGTVGR